MSPQSGAAPSPDVAAAEQDAESCHEAASQGGLLLEMAGMREWLDKHRCAPSMFKYRLEQESVIIEVEFKEEEEAEIFKQYFDRAKTIQISVGVPGSEL